MIITAAAAAVAIIVSVATALGVITILSRRESEADLDDIYGSLTDLQAIMEEIRDDLRAIRNRTER